MRKGTIKWFSEAGGFGFIEIPEQKDVLIHFSATQKSGFRTLAESPLAAGCEVAFDLAEGAEALEAVNIRRESETGEEPVD